MKKTATLLLALLALPALLMKTAVAQTAPSPTQEQEVKVKATVHQAMSANENVQTAKTDTATRRETRKGNQVARQVNAKMTKHNAAFDKNYAEDHHAKAITAHTDKSNAETSHPEATASHAAK